MLYYSKKGEGKVIVFLHGFLENMKMWSYFQEVLSSRYQVITIDLPGHGNSLEEAKEICRMEDMALEVKEVLDSLGINEVTIIGHSMGGYVALAFSEMYTAMVDGIGLVYSTFLPDDEIKKEQRLRAAELVVKNPKDFFRLSIPNLFSQNYEGEFEKEIQEAIFWAEETSMLGITGSLKGMRERPDRRNIVCKINKPVLIIAGKEDKAIDISVFREKEIISSSNVSYYELSTGHMGVLEAPEETLEIIKDWLEKVYLPIRNID